VHTAGVSVRCVMCGSSGYEHFVVLTHVSPHPAAGENEYGQLGDGTTGSCCRKNVPTAVSGDLQWIGLSAGSVPTARCRDDLRFTHAPRAHAWATFPVCLGTYPTFLNMTIPKMKFVWANSRWLHRFLALSPFPP
jgi:hypothetical protein